MGYAPHPSPSGDTYPPRGRLYQRHIFKISNGLRQSVTKRAMPAPGGKAISKAII